MGWKYLTIPKHQRLHRWSLGMGEVFHLTLYWACDYLFRLGLKLIHVNTRVPRRLNTFKQISSVLLNGWILYGNILITSIERDHLISLGINVIGCVFINYRYAGYSVFQRHQYMQMIYKTMCCVKVLAMTPNINFAWSYVHISCILRRFATVIVAAF